MVYIIRCIYIYIIYHRYSTFTIRYGTIYTYTILYYSILRYQCFDVYFPTPPWGDSLWFSLMIHWWFIDIQSSSIWYSSDWYISFHFNWDSLHWCSCILWYSLIFSKTFHENDMYSEWYSMMSSFRFRNWRVCTW